MRLKNLLHVNTIFLVYGDNHVFEVNENIYDKYWNKNDVDEKHHCEIEEKGTNNMKTINQRKLPKRKRKILKHKDYIYY